MYKNNKKSKKNRPKPQNSNPQNDLPSETLKNPSENIEKPEPPKTKFTPGQIIKFTGLISKPELNGRSGVIRKAMENDRYRIMIGEETDLAIKESNLIPLDQCPSENRLNITGMLIWPHIKGISAPSMQWMDDFRLTRSFINPFDKRGPFKHYWAQPHWQTAEDMFISPVVHDQWITPTGLDGRNRSIIMRDYETRLKKLLNWKNPMMWINTSGASDNNEMCVYWDGDSSAPINDLVKTRYPNAASCGCVPEMRGPVVYIEGLQAKNIRDLNDPTRVSVASLNYQKAQFYNKRYHKLIHEGIEDEKKAKMFKKEDLRIAKVLIGLPICENVCGDCREARAFYKKRMNCHRGIRAIDKLLN